MYRSDTRCRRKVQKYTNLAHTLRGKARRESQQTARAYLGGGEFGGAAHWTHALFHGVDNTLHCHPTQRIAAAAAAAVIAASIVTTARDTEGKQAAVHGTQKHRSSRHAR